MKTIFSVLLVLVLLWGCDRNHPPVISGITCSPATRSAGTQFSLAATATDEDGNSLQYRWSADGGSFPDSANRNRTTWKSPADGTGKTFTIELTVSDGKSESSMTYAIQLTEPVFGAVSGQVFFAGCTVPVEEATVLIDDKTALTDSTGYFHLSDIPVGDYRLKIAKAGFGPVDKEVTILQSVDLKVNIPMTTVTLSSKVSGIVKSRDSLPIFGATITMLNPDLSESKITATTDIKGYYLLRYVPLGQRRLIVRKEATALYGYPDISLDLDIRIQEYPLDIEMEKIPLTGQFTDTRDGHKYGYKVYGTHTWMTENLAYLPTVNLPTEGNVTGRYCYVYDYSGKDTAAAKATDNYKYYGVLYNWSTAQSICPPGWHLPAEAEWTQLENFIGPDTGTAMKSTSTWSNRGNGTNSSGFKALAAGGRRDDGVFIGLGDGTGFWTTMDMGTQLGRKMSLSSLDGYLWSGGVKKGTGSSVRCVKN
jgi:uncharacterized protein (TIGR02145 family)